MDNGLAFLVEHTFKSFHVDVLILLLQLVADVLEVLAGKNHLAYACLGYREFPFGEFFLGDFACRAVGIFDNDRRFRDDILGKEVFGVRVHRDAHEEATRFLHGKILDVKAPRDGIVGKAHLEAALRAEAVDTRAVAHREEFLGVDVVAKFFGKEPVAVTVHPAGRIFRGELVGERHFRAGNLEERGTGIRAHFKGRDIAFRFATDMCETVNLRAHAALHGFLGGNVLGVERACGSTAAFTFAEHEVLDVAVELRVKPDELVVGKADCPGRLLAAGDKLLDDGGLVGPVFVPRHNHHVLVGATFTNGVQPVVIAIVEHENRVETECDMVIEPFGKIKLVTVDLYKTVDVHHR